ncbi:unnamed protein product [Linum trigynum]|uniref:CCHC-type domain-containing protein n=1 Tax=Linum trigynum TaxID=586398 RepID=A0AAV2DFL9_9ROSI
MLSTAIDGNPAPAPPLLPSDRPPDPPISSAVAVSATLPANVASATISSDMLIDGASLSLSQQGITIKEAGVQAEPTGGAGVGQAPLSYANAVAGITAKAPIPNQLIQWSPVGEHDLVTGEHNGEPALKISSAFKERICAPWHRTLVIRLLGLRIGFVTLCNRLKGIWRPTGAMEIKDLDHDCFLVKLDNEQDYFRALTDSPWVIYDHYLVVQQWTPNFKASDPLPKKMIVWVQLPALKIHFYHKEVLNMLENLIGRTIKLDFHTLTQQRAKFARIAVEVDLSKPLVPRIWLDDDWQKVEYENLPEVCFQCGKIGHSLPGCPQNQPATPAGQTVIAGGTPPLTPPAAQEDSSPGFGPWMLVSRKSRRNSRETHRKGNTDLDSGNQITVHTGKSGKEIAAIKEPVKLLPSTSTLNDSGIQRNAGQERKGAAVRKGGDEVIKGKGKATSELTSNGKGLLGPKPNCLTQMDNGPRQAKESNGASTSALLTDPKPRTESAVNPAATAHIPNVAQPPSPPAVRTVKGQNGSLMQIVVHHQENQDGRDETLNSSPSVAKRTKRSKGKKSQAKGSPAKLHQLKAL